MAVDEVFFAAIVTPMEIGTVLAEARKAAGLQQKALASIMGISASYLCDLEGNRRPFPIERMIQLPQSIRPKVAEALMKKRLSEIEQLRSWVEVAE